MGIYPVSILLSHSDNTPYVPGLALSYLEEIDLTQAILVLLFYTVGSKHSFNLS